MARLRYLWIVLLLLHAFVSQAQLTCTDDLILYRKGKLWGVCDSAKKIIVAPEYDEVKILYGKIIQAEKKYYNGKPDPLHGPESRFTLFTANGAVITEADYMLEFKNGYSSLYSKSKCGLIDTFGRIIVPLKYYHVYYAGEGLVVCKKKEGGGSLLLELNGTVRFESDTVSVTAFSNGRAWISTPAGMGSIGHDGKFNWFPRMPKYYYTDTWGSLKKYNTQDGKGGYGVVNYFGKTIIPANGNWDIKTFGNGRLLLVEKKRNQFGVYDTSGNEMLPCEYTEVNFFRAMSYRPKEEGSWKNFNAGSAYVLLKKDTLCGLADSNCRIIIPVVYRQIIYAGENRLKVLTTEGKWGIMDMAGNWIAKPDYEDVSESYGGMIWGEFNRKYTVIDHEGNILGGSPFDGVVTNERYFRDSIMAVYRSKQWGVLAGNGNLVLPCDYKQLNISAGMIYVKADSTWAIYNAKGNLLHQQYNWIGYFSDGYAWALRGKKLFILDTTGNATALPDSVTIKRNESGIEFHRGFAYALVNGKYRLVDVQGNVVPWALKYDRVQLYGTGFIVYRNLKMGYAESNGKELLPPLYDNLVKRSDRTFFVYVNGKPGFAGAGGVNYFED